MEISRIQNQSSFRGLYYDKNCRMLVEKYINPKDFPKVFKDLTELAKKVDIYIKPTTIPVAKNFSIPAIEYKIKPSFIKRLFGQKTHTDYIDLSSGIGDRISNILPLEIKRTMKLLKLDN